VEMLYGLVKASAAAVGKREDAQQARSAASNAMTVLARAGVLFTRKHQDDSSFFRGIQIPFADLTKAQLSGVDLSGADLSNVRLNGAKLNQTNLSGCNMTHVDLKKDMSMWWENQEQGVNCVCFSPDGLRIAAGLHDGTVLLWGIDIWPGPTMRGDIIDICAKGVNCVCFSPDSSTIVSGSSDASVRLWGIDGTPGLVLRGRGRDHRYHGVMCVAVSPDGRTIAAGYWGGDVRLWCIDGTPGPVLQSRESGSCWPSCDAIAFSPDGSSVVAITYRGVEWWGIDGTRGPEFQNPDGTSSCVCISPDGLTAASTSGNEIRLWSIDGTPRPAIVLRGHQGKVTRVVFSPDSNIILSVSDIDDKTIRLWSADGTPGAVFRCFGEEVRRFCFSPDGRYIVSGSQDGTVRLWARTDTGNLRQMFSHLPRDRLESSGCLLDGTVDLSAENREFLGGEIECAEDSDCSS
jgi:WD40 repeat protein